MGNVYTVAKVKSFRGMEGYGFNAELRRNGVPVALVIDDANGGAYTYEWNDYKAPGVEVDVIGYDKRTMHLTVTPEEALFWEYAKTLTKDEDEYPSPDSAVAGLVDAFETDKMWRRKCKKCTCFRLKDQEPGAYFTRDVIFTPKIAELLRQKYGDTLEVVYNEKY